MLGTNALNTLKVNGVVVGLAANPGEAAKVTAPYVDGSGTLDCGIGATIAGVATFNNATGTLNALPATALNIYNGGSVTVLAGGGTLTTLNVDDGSTCAWYCNSTITNWSVLRNSTFDVSGNLQGKTITNAATDSTCTINDPNSTITWSNGFTLNGQVATGVYQTGPGRLWTVV